MKKWICSSCGGPTGNDRAQRCIACYKAAPVHGSFWTNERIELLKKLWIDGLSASQICQKLGAESRCAVIGKVRRMGLASRTKHSAPNPPKPRKPRVSKPGRITVRGTGFHASTFQQSPSIPHVEAPPVVPDATTACSILDLAFDQCRWIVGDSRTPLHPIYCGGKASTRSWGKFGRGSCPYCDSHADMATNKRAA